jgi:hypothetical protein
MLQRNGARQKNTERDHGSSAMSRAISVRRHAYVKSESRDRRSIRVQGSEMVFGVPKAANIKVD